VQPDLEVPPPGPISQEVRGTPMSTETTSQDTATRAFYRNDYRRAARMLQSMRHVRGDVYTAKDEVSLAKVDTLVHKTAVEFASDSTEFDPELFFAGTQLPAKPVYTETEDSNEFADDDSDYDPNE
jgi:hypothetical protein